MSGARFEIEINNKLGELAQAALRIPTDAGDRTIATLAKLQGQAMAYREALALHHKFVMADMDEAA